MTEIVAERGYKAVTVRELAGIAGVSTRTFYQHYSGKEECFLHIHQRAVRRMLRSVAVSQEGAHGSERLTRAVAAIARGWSSDPAAARLVLLDVYDAGSAALKQAQRASRSLEAQIVASFDCAIDGITVPPLIARGIVSGLVSVERRRQHDGLEKQQPGLSRGLEQWALSYRSQSIARLEALDQMFYNRGLPGSDPVLSSKVGGEGEGKVSDRALLLAAVTKLAAAEDSESLTPRKISAAAGVSRRVFGANFTDVENCFAAALESRVEEAIARARQASVHGRTRAGSIYQAVASLSAQIAKDNALSSLCFRVPGNGNAGSKGMRCQVGPVYELGRLVKEQVGTSSLISNLEVEASIGALWGVLSHEVTAGRAAQAPQRAASFAYLLLAPSVGALAATEAIQKEVRLTPSWT